MVGRIAGALVTSGMVVGFVGVLGPIFIGWIQIFAIIALGLPENVDQLAWVGRVIAGAVLFALVTIPSGLGLALFADRLEPRGE